MGQSSFARLSSNPERDEATADERFIKSMNIGFNEWHDGIGYDLEALKNLTPEEVNEVERLLVNRKDADWRDVEGLAALATPATIQALIECLNSPNNDCRLFAVRFLKQMNVVDRVDEVLLNTLPRTKIGEGLSFALDLAGEYPSEPIKRCILWCALYGNEDIRIHCAAMSLFLYGKAKMDFDSNQKIVFEFKESNLQKRIESFRTLCSILGVNPSIIETES